MDFPFMVIVVVAFAALSYVHGALGLAEWRAHRRNPAHAAVDRDSFPDDQLARGQD